MPIRVGFLGVAHMHAWGYVSALQACGDARVAAVWDPETKRKAMEGGATGLITKPPIDFALLREQIDARLGQAGS